MDCEICYNSPAKFRTHCGHKCCVDCFNCIFECNSSYPVECFGCHRFLADKECIKYLNKENRKKYLRHKSFIDDLVDKFLYKCYKINCKGEIRYFESDRLNKFNCPECHQINCVRCEAIHGKDESCKIWRQNNQDRVKERAERYGKLQNNCAMYCVRCGTFCERVGGCYGVKCGVCKTSLCFITQKARWGPEGYGDNSGGCKCSARNKCHANCIGCTVDPEVQWSVEAIFSTRFLLKLFRRNPSLMDMLL